MKSSNGRIRIALAQVLVVMAVLMMGCTDYMDRVGSLAPTEVLRFTASLGDEFQSGTSSRSTSGHLSIVEEDWKLEALPADTASSRATLTTSLSGNAQVLGYNINEVKLFDAPFTFDADELVSDSPIYWKNFTTGGQLSVYAYMPTNLNVDRTDKSITCTIADTEAAIKQADIVVAKRVLVTGQFRKLVPLTFNHALTAVRFQLGEDLKTEVGTNDVTIGLSGVNSTGKYTLGDTWTGQSNAVAYTPKVDEILMMIPQTLPKGAKVTITYGGKTFSTSIAGKKWEAGKFITYTLHGSTQPSTIYFDLAAGDVVLGSNTYSGFVFVNGVGKSVTGDHEEDNVYYVYQSSEQDNAYKAANTGYVNEEDYNTRINCRIPNYPGVTYNNRPWSEFITNNTCVEDVIEIWDDGKNIRGDSAPDENHVGKAVVRDAGRTHTPNYIKVEGTGTKYNLTIDNVYSVRQHPVDKSQSFRRRAVGGIAYVPSGNTELTINFVGDNRMGCLHINDSSTDKITLQGTGTLTVADADFLTVKCLKNGYQNEDFGDMNKGYISNFWNSAIGANTNDGEDEKLYNLYINSGVIFAGTTKAEDCTAIGGGGNGLGQVTITGGVVTAVATTAGTAIGGGMGHTAPGGQGEVHITGGNIYAYNFSNRWGIASSAIGGGGSFKAPGSIGMIDISGGYVYAYSELGTAIGGGSSGEVAGGGATINITGGTVLAKSKSIVSIGGGSSCLQGGSSGIYDGGTATVTINGSPIIRTGSVGGGTTGDTNAKIGSAKINISGTPDIQAQFVMAKGAVIAPEFNMFGGTIRNSNTNDMEYLHIVEHGGAVYLEDGTCTISGGTIQNCTAKQGGAIYMKGGKCEIYGGTIQDNLAQSGHGGGIYIEEGSFTMNGTSALITQNSAIQRENVGGSGGGLYITSDEKEVSVDILSGTITGNTSDRKGGGICVEVAGEVPANVNVGTNGEPNLDISGNHTLLSGGGLYVSGKRSVVTINGGKIMNNTTSAYVANENVANEGGLVTLYSGDVTHNVVTFYSNGGQGDTETRKVVTATNGLLNNAPEFTRVGYTFVSWNTRADGQGTTYRNNEVINISTDLELYAQWQLE